MTANCPSCGAQVEFKSGVSVFSVCEHCRSMIVRRDVDVESIGKMAQLPDDVSPLKTGTRGKFKNTGFGIVGRLKVQWSEGRWNEWFLIFDDGKYGWLAEAMGMFIISFEVTETSKVPPVSQIAPARGYELAPGRTFFVDDIKEAECVASEGELPFMGMAGRKSVSVDLSNHAGEFASIEYADDGVRLYIGKYVDFEELDFANLRDLDSEIKRIRKATLFKCPSCGGPFSLLTPGLTASVACNYCGSTIDTTHETLDLITKAEKKITFKPLIPIGKKGKLHGFDWEVTGYVRRTDESGFYSWDEYLLFNPFKGFRWLTTYKGHWNFVEMIRTRPSKESGSKIKFRDKTFVKFLVGKGKVSFVIGEFYWRVKLGETVDLADYICPPEILSRESDGSEDNWSLGKYIEPEVIASAFGVKEGMPEKTGVAPNQVSPYKPASKSLKLAFAGMLLLCTALQIYFVAVGLSKEVYRGTFTFSNRETQKTLISPSFELPDGSNNLSAELHSELSNDWIGADISLVNEKTNDSLDFEQGVEYYSGSDSDGAWSEGSKETDTTLASVPGGRYHLVIQPAFEPPSPGSAEKIYTFDIAIKRGVIGWCNYIIAMIMLSVYPLWLKKRSSGFESQRWAESDLGEQE